MILGSILLIITLNITATLEQELTVAEKHGDLLVDDIGKVQDLYLLYKGLVKDQEVALSAEASTTTSHLQTELCKDALLRQHTCIIVLAGHYFHQMGVLPDLTEKPGECKENILTIYLIGKKRRKLFPANIWQSAFVCPVLYNGKPGERIHLTPDGIKNNGLFAMYRNIDRTKVDKLPYEKTAVLIYYPNVFDINHHKPIRSGTVDNTTSNKPKSGGSGRQMKSTTNADKVKSADANIINKRITEEEEKEAKHIETVEERLNEVTTLMAGLQLHLAEMKSRAKNRNRVV